MISTSNYTIDDLKDFWWILRYQTFFVENFGSYADFENLLSLDRQIEVTNIYMQN